MWERLTGNSEDGTNDSLDLRSHGMLSHVMICAVLHGGKPLIKDFKIQDLIETAHRCVIHPFTAFGHTTFFCWNDDNIVPRPPSVAADAPYIAAYGPPVRRSELFQAWRAVLFHLDMLWRGRRKGIHYTDYVHPNREIGAGLTFRETPDKVKRFLQSSNACDQAPSTDHEEVNRILHYLHEHYDEAITLKSMAQLVALEEHYVSSLFKKKTGDNLIAYLHRLRIDRAKELLQHTDLSVNAIGLKVGFEHSNYFIKIFKRVTRTTPADYRKESGKRFNRD